MAAAAPRSAASSGQQDPEPIGGYSTEFFVGNIDKDYLCSICHDVLRQPVEAYNADQESALPSTDPDSEPCCHLFCRGCITRWLESKNSCPECRKHLTVKHLHRAVRLQRKIWSLPVRCRKYKLGCSETGQLGREASWWGTHEESHCELTQVQCPYCNILVLRRDLEKHKGQRCGFRPAQCEFCDVTMRQIDLKQHAEKVCPKKTVPCPNKCINQETSEPLMLPREHLARHISDECQNATVRCGYACVGCDVALPRKELEQHLQDAVHRHMMLTSGTLANLVGTLQNVQVGMVSLARENNELRKVLKLPDKGTPNWVRAMTARPISPVSSSSSSSWAAGLAGAMDSKGADMDAAGGQQTLRRRKPQSSNTFGGNSLSSMFSGVGVSDAAVDEKADTSLFRTSSQVNLNGAHDVVDSRRVDKLEEMLHIPGSLEWSVDKWSAQPVDTRLYSKSLVRNNKKWRGTVEKKDDGAISIFLRYEEGPRPLYVRLVLMVMSQRDPTRAVVTSSLTHTYEDLSSGGFQGWGCNRFCTLADLIAKGGYLKKEDRLTFRIDFIVDNKRLKLEEDLSMLCRRIEYLEKASNVPVSMEWTKRQWKEQAYDVSFFSPVIFRGGKRWRGSIEKKRSGHVSVYLRYEKGYRPLQVHFKLSLLGADGTVAIERQLTHVYTAFEDGGYTGWGYHKFCTLQELEEKGAYDADSDSVTVRVEFTEHELPRGSSSAGGTHTGTGGTDTGGGSQASS